MASACENEPSINLATGLGYPNPSSLEKIKDICATQNVDLDARDDGGWSPLMVACGRDEKDIAEFLLSQGADPNAKGTKDGNTPMHCALGYHCKEIPQHENDHCNSWNKQSRIEILRHLIRHGANLACNSNGLDPPCLAAIYTYQDIVEFFVQGDDLQLSNVEKGRVYEILGVAIGLNTDFQSHADRNELDLCSRFCRALSFYEEDGCELFKNDNRSDVAKSFSLFAVKACKTQEDWESIKSDAWELMTQCLIVAERVLPSEFRNSYLLRRLLKLGFNGIFKAEKNAERLSQSYQIYRDAIQWEGIPGLQLTKILVDFIKGLSETRLFPDDPVIHECYQIMDLNLQVLSKRNPDDLPGIGWWVDDVGSYLFGLAFDGYYKKREIFEKLLQVAERMIKIMRRKSRSEKCGDSLTQFLINDIDKVFWTKDRDNKSDESHRHRHRMRERRMKHFIGRILQCEDVTEIYSEGYTMLHLLLADDRLARLQLIRDIALMLVRNGCDIEARNAHGETVSEMITKSSRFNPEASGYKELMAILTPPTSPLPLQEMVARLILRLKIPHEGILPKHLSLLILGDAELGSDAFRDSDSESDSSYYSPDYSSLENSSNEDDSD